MRNHSPFNGKIPVLKCHTRVCLDLYDSKVVSIKAMTASENYSGNANTSELTGEIGRFFKYSYSLRLPHITLVLQLAFSTYQILDYPDYPHIAVHFVSFQISVDGRTFGNVGYSSGVMSTMSASSDENTADEAGTHLTFYNI